jgi:hypothetical protein
MSEFTLPVSMRPCKKKFHTHVLVICFNPTHKTEIEIANRWETTSSNPAGQIKLLDNQKQETVNRDDMPTFFKQGSSRAPQPVQFSRVTEVFRWIHWNWLFYLIQNEGQWGCSSACEFLWDFLVNGLSSRTPARDRLLDMAWTHSKEWAWK